MTTARGAGHHVVDDGGHVGLPVDPQYRGQPFARVLVLRIVGVTGWAAAGRLIQP